MPESCTLAPAAVCVDAPAIAGHLPSAGMPTLIPITMVDGGVAAVSVTSIVPVAAIGKLWKSRPPTATVPVNVSVVRVTVGVVVGVELLLPHAETTNASATQTNQARHPASDAPVPLVEPIRPILPILPVLPVPPLCPHHFTVSVTAPKCASDVPAVPLTVTV